MTIDATCPACGSMMSKVPQMNTLACMRCGHGVAEREDSLTRLAEHHPVQNAEGPADTWTEGKKLDQGKAQMGLISGIFMYGLARVLTFGAKKYAAHNWRKGIAYSRLFDALMRHLWAWWMGEEIDPESGESHLDHAACCLMFLRELSQTRPELDDRFKISGKAPAPACPTER
jgi:hypothetical protein